MDQGAAWKVDHPVEATSEDVIEKRTVAIMMPTTMRGTPTAKRSLNAEAKQNLPYCKHIPYIKPNQR